jgi:DNA polymerase-3 subunit alpha
MQRVKYNCGCEFDLDENGKVILATKIENMPLDCKLTWDLLCSGDTLGVFQLESHLGKSLAKKVLPRNIEELADLISIMRPGVLEAVEDGKNLTTHYIDRKHGREDVTYYHKALEPIVNKTYGILVYQEQAMEIAKELAGFTMQEADTMRKAIGKKLPEEMAKVKTLFMSRAKEKGILNDTEINEVFGWIEKSQRYSFNKSHAVSYAIDGYLSAYCKAHFPREFFTSYLAFSKNEANFTEAVSQLVANAKRNGIDVFPPDVRKRNHNYKLYDDGIYCGISNIKGVGTSILASLDEIVRSKEVQANKSLDKWSWTEFLMLCGESIKKNAFQALVSAGALSFLKVSRRRMLYEYDKFCELTSRDITFLQALSGESFLQKLKSLEVSAVGRGKPLSNKKAKEKVSNLVKQLENPPYSLEDSAAWISEIESQAIGISLTCSKVDDCDQSAANCNCKDFLDGKAGFIMMAVNLDEVREHTIKNGTKKGEKMAFIKASDSSCSLDGIVCFTEAWTEYKETIIQGNTVMLGGSRDKKNKDTFVVTKAWQI